MGPKYEFTNETLNWEGYTLHRIKRLSDGKLGGWIWSEANLSQEGNCWVDGDAKVYSEAKVYGNAKVYNKAYVHGDAEIYGNAKVYGNAEILGNANVYGEAQVYENAFVFNKAKVCNNAEVFGKAKVFRNAKVDDSAKVYGNAQVFGNCYIYDSAIIFGNARVYDQAYIFGDAEVYDQAQVYGEAFVFGNAEVYDYAKVYGGAQVYGNAKIFGNTSIYDLKIDSGEYADEKCEEDYNNNLEDNAVKEVVQNFIYKVNDSNKLTAQTEYDSIDEFFNEPVANDVKLDTLVICAIDTKEPLIKLQKVEVEDKTEFKFIVDIINEDGDNFMFKSMIKSQEQLSQFLQQTIDALRLYQKFSKYADDLKECL